MIKKQKKKVVVKKKLSEEESKDNSKTKPHDVLAPKNRWWSIRYLLQQRKRFSKDNINFMINMELSNGFITNFIAYPDQKEGSFKYLGRKYIVDQSMKYYCLSSSMWCLDYHQNFSAPIQRKILVKDIKDEIINDDNIEIEYATNPSLIEEFTNSKIAEGIMRGRQMDELLKQLRLMMLIVIGIGLAHFLIYLRNSGII
jgi:hypothetical protein